MAARLNPYIAFDGNARAAMEFYRDVFGGELRINTYGEYGDAAGPHADRVMHSLLETPDGYTLMGSDLPPGGQPEPRGSISISLSGGADESDRLREQWTRLTADGTVTMPLAKQVWGDEFGMCTDRFGVTWMVNISAA